MEALVSLYEKQGKECEESRQTSVATENDEEDYDRIFLEILGAKQSRKYSQNRMEVQAPESDHKMDLSHG